MALGGIIGFTSQVQPDDPFDLGQILFDTYAPLLVALLVVLGIALVFAQRSRSRGAGKPQAPPPAWYPDPWGEPYERWWNGATWTPAVRAYPWPGPPPGQGPSPEAGYPPR